MKPVIKYGLRSIVREIVLAYALDTRQRAGIAYQVVVGQANAFGSAMSQQGRQSLIGRLRSAFSDYTLAMQLRLNELSGGRKSMGDKQMLAVKVFRALIKSGAIRE